MLSEAKIRRPIVGEKRFISSDVSARTADELAEIVRAATDPEDLERALRGLVSLLDEGGLAYFVAFLTSNDVALRTAANTIMADTPELLSSRLPLLLTDQEENVRIFAAESIPFAIHPDTEHWIIDALEVEDSVNVVCALVNALITVGTEICIPTLQSLKTLWSDSPLVIFAADLALETVDPEVHCASN
ncbi:MAG: hypothetical protein AAGH41_14325 [Pseudomonadota bacterium]